MSSEIPSKTQRKKAMLALQELGAELVTLNEDQLAGMRLPERLQEAVAAAKRIAGFEARRRQLQYIGKLMRTLDAEPIRAQLDAWNAASRERTAAIRSVERWRERLLTDASALNEFIEAYPHGDSRQLRALVRNAQRERTTDAPRKSYRALFKFLRETLASRPPPPASL